MEFEEKRLIPSSFEEKIVEGEPLQAIREGEETTQMYRSIAIFPSQLQPKQQLIINIHFKRGKPLGLKSQTASINAICTLKFGDEAYLYDGSAFLTQLNLFLAAGGLIIEHPNKHLTFFDPTPFANLTELHLRQNKISSIDVSCNPLLIILRIDKNRLEEIDLTRNPLLKILKLCQNKLIEINLSKNHNLEQVSLPQNQLRNVCLRNCPKVSVLDLISNRIRTVAFWPLSLQDLSLGDQSATKCIATLLHEPGEAEQCTQYGRAKIDQEYSGQQHSHQDCKYSFRLEEIRQ